MIEAVVSFTRSGVVFKASKEEDKKQDQSASIYADDGKIAEDQALVKISGFTKVYDGSDVKAVDNLNLTVCKGDIFGFIGRNGAGKSTTIKCLTGQLPFKQGSITVCGFDINKDAIKAKKMMGFVSDDHAVYEKMTGRQYVNFIADVFGTGKEREERIEALKKQFSIEAAFDKPIGSYSHGMKQKICLIASLVHEPDVWVLDEPLTGLDVVMMHQVKQAMINHAKKGKAVFFSSHNLDVVERICNKAAIINHGQFLGVIDIPAFRRADMGSLEEFFFSLVGENDETI